MNNLFNLISQISSINDTNNDFYFDNFVENVNSTPLSNYRYQHNQSVDINQNIINNMYYIRRSIEINIEHQALEFRRREFTESNNNLHDLFNNFLDVFSDNFDNFDIENIGEDVKITLSNDEFNKLNTSVLDETTLKECPICLDDISLNDKLIILKCKHIYHRNCIKEWLCNQSTKCCVCRFDCRYN